MSAFQILEVSLTFGAAFIFTILSFLLEEHEFQLKLLASILWYVTTFVYFITGLQLNETLLFGLSFLWLGLGIVLTILAFQNFFKYKKEERLKMAIT